jgi:hypothetical protein
MVTPGQGKQSHGSGAGFVKRTLKIWCRAERSDMALVSASTIKRQSYG